MELIKDAYALVQTLWLALPLTLTLWWAWPGRVCISR